MKRKTEPIEKDSDRCASARTIWVEETSDRTRATLHMRCVLPRSAHTEPRHMSCQQLGDVWLTATWPGPFAPLDYPAGGE